MICRTTSISRPLEWLKSTPFTEVIGWHEYHITEPLDYSHHLLASLCAIMVNVNSDPDKSERVTSADFLPAPALASRKSSAEQFAETGWNRFISKMVEEAPPGSIEGFTDCEDGPEEWGDEESVSSNDPSLDDGPIDLGA